MCGTMTAAQRLRCITLSVRLSGPLIRGRNLSYKKLYIYGSFFLVAPQPLMCIHKCIHNIFAVTAKLWSHSFLGYINTRLCSRIAPKSIVCISVACQATQHMAMIQPSFTSSKWNMGESLPFLA